MRLNVPILVAFCLFVFAAPAACESYAVSNSAHGIDVISVISYANAEGLPYKFMTSPDSAQFVASKVGSGHEVLLVQSRDHPFTGSLKGMIESEGSTVELFESVDPLKTNLVLAERSGASRFIVVDTSYGYNSLSVMPYAAVTGAYILLADGTNAQAVGDFLSSVSPEWVLQYGYLEDPVKEALRAELTDSIDTGDKYMDNIEIVKRYIKAKPTSQAVLMDGSMVEYGASKGDDPILFVSGVIPDPVFEYIKSSGLNTLVLVGGDLVPAVDSMKDRLADSGKTVSVFIKFGQTTPGVDSSVKSLEMFPLPAVPLDIEVKSVEYNDAEDVLEVTYANRVDAPAYVQADVELEAGGNSLKTFTDSEPLLVAKNSEAGRRYELDLASLGVDGEVYAEVRARFGSTPSLMEKAAAGRYLVETISFTDQSQLDATRLYYDASSKQVLLEVRNTGPVTAYAMPSFDLATSSGTKSFVKESMTALETGKSRDVSFPGVELSPQDVSLNEKVDVHIDYGAREGMLTKSLDESLELESAPSGGGGTLIIMAALAAAAVIALALMRKRKKRR